jgi:peptidoglycan hydrolase-like protein with peptidoglycan-binding domain
MRRTVLVMLSAALVVVSASACGGATNNQTPLAGGTAAPVSVATANFCSDLGSYVQVIDRYARVFQEEAVTVGDMQTAAAALTAARSKVTQSAAELADSINAANKSSAATAAGGVTTTTAVLQTGTAQDHIDAITTAEKNLQDASQGIDPSTPLRTAAVELQAAAVGVEQAYVSLFLDAGCLPQDAAAARAAAAYVKALQQDLTTAGYYTGPVDGLYGPATVAAVKALQKDAGLPQTGVVDQATELALAQKLTAKGQQQSLNVAALQGALTSTGHYHGPVDGKWSDELEQAVKAYQQSQQLPQTGAVDAATLASLLHASSAAGGSSTTTASPTTSTSGPTGTTR